MTVKTVESVEIGFRSRWTSVEVVNSRDGHRSTWFRSKWKSVEVTYTPVFFIDIEYNKRLDRQRPCLEGDSSGGSNNIVQSKKISLTPVINYTCSVLRCLAIISSLV